MPINKSEVTKILALDLGGVPDEDKDAAKQEVLDYVIEQCLADYGRALSPVTGKDFEPLSPAYAAYKSTISSAAIPNMELKGDLLDAFIGELLTGDQVKLGWTDPDQAIKAFNHTTGDTVPKRPLLPEAKQDFRPEIMEGIEAILRGYRAA